MTINQINPPKKSRIIGVLSVALFFLMTGYGFHAKADEPSTIGETDIRPYEFGGSLSIISEGYLVNGIDPRRPPGLGQVQFNSNFSILGLQSGINILYSTDDNRFRQSMNQFNFQGSWRWLTVAAGTVAPGFTKYSLGGVSITGGMIDINPAWFSLTMTGGRTKRAVDFTDEIGFREPSYERWLYAARMGFGNRDGTELALSGVYAYDVTGSIDNPGEILPAQNINVTPELKLSLFQGRFRLDGNATISAFTRDRRGSALEISELDEFEWLTDLITINSSTRLDYAGEISSQLRLGPVRLNGSYERVQPGFRSLGLGRIRSDHESYRIRGQFRLFEGRANVSGMYTSGRNNLMDDKISTLQRNQVATTLALRISQKVNLSLSYMQMSNVNEPVNPNNPIANQLHTDIISRNIMITPTMIIQRNMISHSISINGAYQILEDNSIMVLAGERPSSEFDNTTVGANYNITLPGSLSLSFSGNLMKNNTETGSAIGNAFNASTGYSFFERKLTTSISLGWSRNGIEFVRIIDDPDHEDMMSDTVIRHSVHNTSKNNNDFLGGEYVVEQWSNQYSINLSTSYRFENGNPLRLSIRGLFSRPDHDGGRRYNEFHAVLRYQHRF